LVCSRAPSTSTLVQAERSAPAPIRTSHFMSVEVTLGARSQGARGILLQEPRGALPGRGGGAVLGQRLDGEHLRLEPEPGPREALAILREQREGTRRVLLLERGFDPGDMGELLAEAR